MANAIFDGTDAVMLSQETAVGRHPVQAVEMMASIAETTERELPYGRWLAERGPQANNQYHAIAFGAVGGVYQLGLKCVVSPTNTGTTARLISAYRPGRRARAVAPAGRGAALPTPVGGAPAPARGADGHARPDRVVRPVALDEGFAVPGDKIGITAGPAGGVGGGTNLFKVHTLE